jgi:hypothetical protein
VAAVENAEEIRFQNRAKVFRRHLFDWSKDSDTSVVNQNVDSTQRRGGALKERLHLSMVAHVTNKTDCLPAMQFVEGFGRLLDFNCIASANTNSHTLSS